MWGPYLSTRAGTRRRAFGKCLVMRVGPDDWDQCPYMGSPPLLLLHEGTVRRQSRDEEEGSHQTESAGALILLGLPASRSVRNKYLLFRSQSVYFVTAAHMDSERPLCRPPTCAVSIRLHLTPRQRGKKWGPWAPAPWSLPSSATCLLCDLGQMTPLHCASTPQL